jgi:hypothetical protein
VGCAISPSYSLFLFNYIMVGGFVYAYEAEVYILITDFSGTGKHEPTQRFGSRPFR